jgi:alkylation response protein AidB-like acyl-CoA dehydrogenase
MAELGWLGLCFPKEYGGNGANFLDLVILLEEMGRALAPVPFIPTVVLGGLPILSWGTSTQKEQLLPKIARGEIILTLALTELEGGLEPAGLTTKAISKESGFAITGTKFFVRDAHIADYLLCVARTQDVSPKNSGITIFLVDAKSPGIEYVVLKTIGIDKWCEINFNKVSVPRENVVGEVDRGWEIVEAILAQGGIAESAWAAGGAQQVLEMTVKYARGRVQFDRPIGSFQAIQHKCANMLTDVEAMRFATYEAALKLDQGLPYMMEAFMAKAWVNEAYQRVCMEGQQIHGGIGFMKDHDLQLYTRQAKVSELAFGDADFYREKVAQELGL